MEQPVHVHRLRLLPAEIRTLRQRKSNSCLRDCPDAKLLLGILKMKGGSALADTQV